MRIVPPVAVTNRVETLNASPATETRNVKHVPRRTGGLPATIVLPATARLTIAPETARLGADGRLAAPTNGSAAETTSVRALMEGASAGASATAPPIADMATAHPAGILATARVAGTDTAGHAKVTAGQGVQRGARTVASAQSGAVTTGAPELPARPVDRNTGGQTAVPMGTADSGRPVATAETTGPAATTGPRPATTLTRVGRAEAPRTETGVRARRVGSPRIASAQGTFRGGPALAVGRRTGDLRTGGLRTEGGDRVATRSRRIVPVTLSSPRRSRPATSILLLATS